MKKALQILPLFLVTIPAFIIIHIEQQLHNIINYGLVKYEIIKLLIVPPVVVGILFPIVKTFRKACIYAVPFLLVFYFFGIVKDVLHTRNPHAFWSSYSFLLLVTATFLFVLVHFTRKSNSDFRKGYFFINTLFIVFIAIDLVIILTRPITSKNQHEMDGLQPTGNNFCDTCARPDIYYIVFDAYTSSETLRSEFRYDNSSVETYLRSKNFFIAKQSRSNYNLTPFSIASTLNGAYLSDLDVNQDFYINEYLPGIPRVFHNSLVSLLRTKGYEIYNHSIFDFKKSPSTLPPFDLWKTKDLFKRHNLFAKLNADIGWHLARFFSFTNNETIDYASRRDSQLEIVIESIAKTTVTQTRKPKFVYGHLMIPHHPYTFDSSGNKIPQTASDRTIEQAKLAYVNQLVYSNRVLKNLVEKIMENIKRPTVIVLQGDHGFRFKAAEKKHLEFANLNAYYFSNNDYRSLYDSISNVNTFRVVLNSYFHTNYPKLVDTSYFLQYK